jgi:FKBP-type peptidyl-prolyl cis-trans isomerase FkpA
MKRIPVTSMLFAALALVACGQEQAEQAQPQQEPVAEEAAGCSPVPVSDVQSVEIAPGLTSKMLVTGCGDIAENGQTAVVHYTGWLFDGQAENNRGNKFDSSVDRGQHFKFPLGASRVIKGWDQGVAGMAIGEVRELTIAPELAYGDRDMGVIPPGSTLIFEVELAGLEGETAAN